MTQNRARILTLIITTLVLTGIFAALLVQHAVLAMTGTPAPVPAAPAPVSAASAHTADLDLPAVPEAVADPLVAEVLGEGGNHYTTVQADQVQLAADRVCEGFTAGVPLVEMEPELAREFGLGGVEAHEFVIEAHRLHCPLA